MVGKLVYRVSCSFFGALFIALSLGIGFSTAITPLVAEADAENDVSKNHVSSRFAFMYGF
jgi:MATE family multidrug resistance protein